MAVRTKKKNENNQQQAKAGKDNLFDMLQPNNLINNAQKVISSAVDVLEEEIAAGILAAKKIEKKVINVDEIRDDSQNLMNRIRRDTHEALDIFLDALAALSKQLGVLTESVTKQTTNPPSSEKSPVSPLQLLEHGKPARPGEIIEFSFLLQDDAIKRAIELDLKISDFSGPDKQKIAARHIQLMPSTFTLQPGEEKEITARITVPATAAPGQYNSLLTVNQLPAIKIVLSFQVL